MWSLYLDLAFSTYKSHQPVLASEPDVHVRWILGHRGLGQIDLGCSGPVFSTLREM